MVGTTGLLAPYRFTIGPIEGLFLPNNGEGELEASLLFPLFGIHSPIGPIPNLLCSGTRWVPSLKRVRSTEMLGNPTGTLTIPGPTQENLI